jgi:hypothetical protein
MLNHEAENLHVPKRIRLLSSKICEEGSKLIRTVRFNIDGIATSITVPIHIEIIPTFASLDAARKIHYAGVQKLIWVVKEMDKVYKMSTEEKKKADVEKQKRYLQKNREKVNARRHAHFLAIRKKAWILAV